MADEIITLSGQVTKLATRVGQEFVAVRGEIEAVEAKIDGYNPIDDAAASSTTTTYSASKIEDAIVAAKQAVKDDLLGGAGTAYDTLKELGDLIDTNADGITALENLAAGHVKFDAAQELTDAQKGVARTNIGAAAAADLASEVSAREALESQLFGKGEGDSHVDGKIEEIEASITALESGSTEALEALKEELFGKGEGTAHVDGRLDEIDAAIEAEASAREEADGDLQDAIDAITGTTVPALEAKDKAIAQALWASDDVVADITSVTGGQIKALSDAAKAAQDAADAAQADVDALEAAVGDTDADFVATFEAALV